MRCLAVVWVAMVLAITSSAGAEFGTREEAVAMVKRVQAEFAKVGAEQTFAEVNDKSNPIFHDRDLYPFCFNLSDGKILAVASNNAKQFLNTDIRALKDGTGKVYGPDLYAAAQKPEGQIAEVSYMFPRPGADKTPVQKVSFVTKAGDLGCGVGHYK